MSDFIVSARKYRPATFSSVVGQKHITSTLKNAIERGQLAHAYLFCGPRGVGKTTCARIFAKAINCLHPEGAEACNTCESCRSFNDGRSLNIHELDAASNNSVEDIRSLIEQVRIIPQVGRYSVFIIDEVHMLSAAAFNAFLKTLEEPPAHAIFILATTEKHKIIPTILSRCQIYDFNRIRVEDSVEYLKYIASQEGITADDESLNLIAQKADGGMRDALTLLDQCSGSDVITTEAVISAMGLAGNLRTARLLQSIADGDTAKTLEQFRSLWQDGKDPAALLDELSMLQRDLLMQAVAPRGGRELLSGGYDSETLRSLSGAFTSAQLLANLQSIQDALTAMAAQPNPRIAAELCLIRLCRPELCDDVPTLCARVDKLEQAVRSGDIPAPTAAAPAKPAPAPQLEPVPKSSPAQAAQPKPEPKPVFDDAPPWEPPAPPVSVPKAKSESKPVYDDVPPWEPPPEPVASPEERPPWEMPPAPRPEPRPTPKAEHTPEPPAPPVPEPEPEMVPEPAPEPEPAPAPTGAFDWQALCAYMEHELPIGLYNLLLDPLQAAGELADGTLTLHFSQQMVYPIFNKPEIAEKFRLAVQKLTGQNVRVVMQPMDTVTQIKQRQIEELAHFPNVTIR